MVRLTAAACLVVLTCAACAKQTDEQRLRAAIRKTLTTKSFSVEATTTTLGQSTPTTTLEHVGSDARVLTGTTVRGVFVGRYIYATDNADPEVFVRCDRRQANGTVQRFDTYSDPLRRAAKARHIKHRGGVFVIDPLLTDSSARTTGELTLSGGRVKTLRLVRRGTGANLSPPVTISFRFSYGAVPAIKAPPADSIETGQTC